MLKGKQVVSCKVVSQTCFIYIQSVGVCVCVCVCVCVYVCRYKLLFDVEFIEIIDLGEL